MSGNPCLFPRVTIKVSTNSIILFQYYTVLIQASRALLLASETLVTSGHAVTRCHKHQRRRQRRDNDATTREEDDDEWQDGPERAGEVVLPPSSPQVHLHRSQIDQIADSRFCVRIRFSSTVDHRITTSDTPNDTPEDWVRVPAVDRHHMTSTHFESAESLLDDNGDDGRGTTWPWYDAGVLHGVCDPS